ncbi:MAG: hypothetical protein JJT81_02800 [Rubellimicrobium sp.]|nr:hypothetical protein [Rubellimicrobium sp.]
MSIISTSRARSRSSCSGGGFLGFMARLEIAGFRLQLYQRLHPEPKENAALCSENSGMGAVQDEPRTVEPSKWTPILPSLAKSKPSARTCAQNGRSVQQWQEVVGVALTLFRKQVYNQTGCATHIRNHWDGLQVFKSGA